MAGLVPGWGREFYFLFLHMHRCAKVEIERGKGREERRERRPAYGAKSPLIRRPQVFSHLKSCKNDKFFHPKLISLFFNTIFTGGNTA